MKQHLRSEAVGRARIERKVIRHTWVGACSAPGRSVVVLVVSTAMCGLFSPTVLGDDQPRRIAQAHPIGDGGPVRADSDPYNPLTEGNRSSEYICAGRWTDWWKTDCGDAKIDFTEIPIPWGFFGPGSKPPVGVVDLRGVTGPTGDTGVRRIEPLCFSRKVIPATASTPIELVQLDLVSCQPVEVEYSNGDVEEWEMYITLSDIASPWGELTATKWDDDGGTFSSTFPVLPKLTFVPPEGCPLIPCQTRVFDTGREGIPPSWLSVDSVPWVHYIRRTRAGEGETGARFLPMFLPGIDRLGSGYCIAKCRYASPAEAGHCNNHCPTPVASSSVTELCVAIACPRCDLAEPPYENRSSKDEVGRTPLPSSETPR